MSGTVVGNKIVDHSDVVGASPVEAAEHLASRGLGKDNYKMRREIFMFLGLMFLILQVWWYYSDLMCILKWTRGMFRLRLASFPNEWHLIFVDVNNIPRLIV